MQYVNVIIDNNSNSTDKLYTYGTELQGLIPGDKVYVSFAQGNRMRAAYVHSVFDKPPANIPQKKIGSLKMIVEKDPDIYIGQKAMLLSEWMKDRYFCRFIEAIRCFVPAGKPSKKGKLRRPYKEIAGEDQDNDRVLTAEQRKALDIINPHISKGEHEVILIHGVTGSGKTELYMQAIEKCLQLGKTAIMLVPEIALTSQMIHRFLGRFGSDKIAVLHSRLSPGERYDEWIRLRQGDAKIVIGARSAVFAPLENVGIIVMDEEHETTYKSDMSPKYETREVAEELGKKHGALLLLGSATPSLLTYNKVMEGRYKKITLERRYNNLPLPEAKIVDMRKEIREGNKSIFSRILYKETLRCLENGKQVIYFLNRRGYSSFISCRNCGYVMRCEECSISLTYHKAENMAICHYCGRKKAIPNKCPQCGSRYIRHFGIGTEKVWEAAGELFPSAQVDRMDLDTWRKKGSGDEILGRFSKGDTDILVGTQLVAKGLDFQNVGLVGVISADVSLNIPDYRSAERTFQLITQAAGRSGRGDESGNVIIQTYSPDHYAIIAASNHDYRGFYQTEEMIRRQTHYPPYSELVQIILSSSGEEEAQSAATKVKEALVRKTGGRLESILGPRAAPLAKTDDKFRYQLLVKVDISGREEYWKVLNGIRKKIIREKSKEWTVSMDVNPYSFL
ncbi:MAG: replication restart helicase PriA [Anaerovoracaceae bacterium]